MNLLHIIASLDSSLGGTILAARTMATAQTRVGHQVTIACFEATPSTAREPVPCRVEYLGRAFHSFCYLPGYHAWLRREAPGYDAVIIHGVYQFNLAGASGLLEKMGVPFFVYPHGSCDPWFRKFYPSKELKKTVYARLILRRALRRATAVIFTAGQEAELAAQYIGRDYRPEVVPLGLEEPPTGDTSAFFERWPELRNQRFFLFLGRIDPKKGVDLLLSAFAQIDDPAAQLVIAGPCVDPNYLDRLRSSIPPAVSRRVTWCGMLENQVKWGALRAADAFVLPSHTENFGLALVEALACRLPVLSTRRVNIWREIDSARAGWFDEDTAGATLALLRRWLAAPAAEKDAMRVAARACFEQRFTSRASCQAFDAMLGRHLSVTP